MKFRKEIKRPSESFVIGVLALVFLTIGYQAAVFLHRAAIIKIEANRDVPDTVYVYETLSQQVGGNVPQTPSQKSLSHVRKNSEHSPRVSQVRKSLPYKKVETFRFNPNDVSEEELCRLGFTARQARSIINYRHKGGRFRRKSDFAKSYVVSDSIFRRLEPYIHIPLTDLNLADSAAFDALPGIGGWFAAKIIEHRAALGGYSYKEQLMDISRMDQERYDALSDLITVSSEHITPYPLWILPVDSLKRHPYISNYEVARAIVLYRENTPHDKWTIEDLCREGILSAADADRLSRCAIMSP